MKTRGHVRYLTHNLTEKVWIIEIFVYISHKKQTIEGKNKTYYSLVLSIHVQLPF